MAKKDFTNPKTFDELQAIATAEPAAEPKTEPKTDPKRINLALDPALHNFLMILAKSSGKSMNAFINIILQRYMDDHRDSYDLAIKFKESLERK